MKKFWLLIPLAVVLGTSFAWAMNYVQYGHRKAYLGEITMDGTVHAGNVMEKLAEYQTDANAVAELLTEKTYDFGALEPGAKGKHEFIIKNSGKEPLRLEVGASTCKCTLGSLNKNVLAPGESTPITLEWTVGNDVKIFEQSAEIRTNDPIRPAIRLTVNGLVISDIEFQPKKVTFGEVLSGESFEFSTKMYSYFDDPIELVDAVFGSEEMTELAEFEFEPFDPSADDDVYQHAKQGFRITAKVKPGVRQGPIVTPMQVRFKKTGESDATNTPDPKDSTDATSESTAEIVLADGETYVASAECAGRIIGSLSMIESSKLKTTSGGSYVWTLGRLDEDDPLEYKAFVVLKGSQQDEVNLTIGEVYPDDVIQASIGKSVGRGNMKLFPIQLKLQAGQELVDLLGKSKDDFGILWVESDNPKVGRMKVAVKVALEPRP
ncbi:DUF1573 domain-containing protein [Roseiconus nitratireducens]|uniref:DUF1573 domain-containing protein n=1 Tax=Roseiconus nitratireducens TaxID=2605748 RepID=A0A5M6CW45_9BACT|nr:DUF1573 domain-containing protein [Roseiconus nitratireducens]KAA5539303.1 DUF1573 domain-containing protein [Roseiconus nitratireducens]